MTLMEFSMIPLDKGDSFSEYVAATLDIVDRSGLAYRLTPMGTVVEGEWAELLELLDRCFRNLEEKSDRISLSVKFDHRAGRGGRLESKQRSVEQSLGRELNKA
ncbi:MAG: MTH1187 family thiamine-binding protein [Polyangia bacterium]